MKSPTTATKAAMPKGSPSELVEVETFELGKYFGAFRSDVFPGGIASELDRLTDLKAAEETLHWGRNYLFVVGVQAPPQGTAPSEPPALKAVVKMFPHHAWRARLRKRWSGSRARKSWEAALRLNAAGIATPKPLAWIESKTPEGPSFYLCERLEEAFEIRYLFRALADGREQETFPDVDAPELFRQLGRALKRLHDARFWHRDLTVGNVLVKQRQGQFEFHLIDLNRGRSGRRLSLRQRCQDLGRLPLLRQELQREFLASYWDGQAGLLRTLVYRFHLHGFLWKNNTKRILRAPIKKLKGWIRGRSTHAHIPAAPAGVGARERVVWDELSDQPHLHASPASKALTRLQDAPTHIYTLAMAAASLPSTVVRFNRLKKELYQSSFQLPEMGLAVSANPERSEETLEALRDLGIKQLLIRLSLWQPDLEQELDFSRRLVAEGYELVFVLAQNRELVRDRPRWRQAVERVASDFMSLGQTYQLGQAINRSKWGVWNYREYLELATDAAHILQQKNPEVRLLGPSVIDFEYHATLGVLNSSAPGLHFDGVASLLYVDRRGAPEAEQLRLDTVLKVTLLKAIAETSRNCDGESWITEFNWPLWEGPHSPAGKDVSVDEETQANYLVRYFLLALTTGHVTRVYWWQLIARGYGLADAREGTSLRKRPSFLAFRTLLRILKGARFVRKLPTGKDQWMFEFERAGTTWLAAWMVGREEEIELKRQVQEVVSRDGQPLDQTGPWSSSPYASPARVRLSDSPIYLRLN